MEMVLENELTHPSCESVNTGQKSCFLSGFKATYLDCAFILFFLNMGEDLQIKFFHSIMGIV